MPLISDHQFQEVATGSGSLPLGLTPTAEVFITSVFLNITNINDKIELKATVGWQAQLLLLTLVPELTFRIRRGGTGINGTIVFETIDSAYLPGNTSIILPITFTTAFQHTENANVASVGTFQQYFLTVELNGLGAASVFGPVHLDGKVLS